jgi:hypothetical protein
LRAAHSFGVTTPQPGQHCRAQLHSGRWLALNLQYEGEYGSRLTGHGGSMTVVMRFWRHERDRPARRQRSAPATARG